MRGLVLFVSFSFFLNFFHGGFAQEHVSRLPSKKRVLLEEFTGIRCGNCPDGAKVISTIKDVCDTNVFPVSIHSGSYAEPGNTFPDFRTEYGDSIWIFAGGTGFPSAMIQRQQTEYENTLGFYRGQWIKAVKDVLQQDADLNIWTSADIDAKTRKLEISVEYFSLSRSEDFLLNVFILQNGIEGYQNPIGKDYIHNHVLRKQLTGIWGDTISDVKVGEGKSLEYTYVLPDSISGTGVDLRHLEVVVFATRMDRQDVLNVHGCYPRLSNFSESSDVKLSAPSLSSRYAYTFFPIDVQNLGNDTIREIGFKYRFKDDEGTYLWKGEIPSYREAQVEVFLGNYPVAENANNIEIQAVSVNGNPSESEAVSFMFDGPWRSTSEAYLDLKTDLCGDEISYVVRDREGNEVYSNGPFKEGEVISVTDTLFFPEPGIYAVEFRDAWHDGWMQGKKGGYTLKASDGSLLKQNFSFNGWIDMVFLDVKDDVAVEPDDVSNQARVYLREGHLDVYTENRIGIERVEVYSVLGNMLFSQKGNFCQHCEFYLPDVPAQILIVKVYCGSDVTTVKTVYL